MLYFSTVSLGCFAVFRCHVDSGSVDVDAKRRDCALNVAAPTLVAQHVQGTLSDLFVLYGGQNPREVGTTAPRLVLFVSVFVGILV
jgi:hypothetical protein